VRPLDEIGELLNRAYGAQRREVVEVCHRGLRRVTSRLEAGDLALASIEALMLRLPRIDAVGMAKLAGRGDFIKDGDAWQNEPRLPAGQPGGGQWTSGGSTAQPSSGQARPDSSGRHSDAKAPGARQDRSSSAEAEDGDPSIPEIVATATVAQSRQQGDNGFYINRTGGGVFFIPTKAGGTFVRPTEVHALDANAFQVNWDQNGVISLKDAKGTIIEVRATPDDLKTFNSTTGRALGVSIYSFPATPLGSPDSPPTAEEERDLAGARAAWMAGRLASEQSWSGRLTTGAVLLTTALPFLALAPATEGAPVEGPLNAVEDQWPVTEEVSVNGGRPIVRARAYEAGVRALYPNVGLQARTFSAVVNGERLSGVADTLAEAGTDDEAPVEAKYVANWARSLRNPASRAGQSPWGAREQLRMLSQMEKYSEGFDGDIIYQTNSKELALQYYRVFRAAGFYRIRFMITPAGP
jgi:hypothetical protein